MIFTIIPSFVAVAGPFIVVTNLSVDGNYMLGAIPDVVFVDVLRLTVIAKRNGDCGSCSKTSVEGESIIRSFRSFDHLGLVVGRLPCPPVTRPVFQPPWPRQGIRSARIVPQGTSGPVDGSGKRRQGGWKREAKARFHYPVVVLSLSSSLF